MFMENWPFNYIQWAMSSQGLGWCLTLPSTIFHSFLDWATASWVFNQYFQDPTTRPPCFPQKKTVRGLKFWIYKVEEIVLPMKWLRSWSAFYFCKCKRQIFSWHSSIICSIVKSYVVKTKIFIVMAQKKIWKIAYKNTAVAIVNQRTNGPVNVHLISGPWISIWCSAQIKGTWYTLI